MFCVKRTACYFMQLQGRLQWLFSNSPPLPACLMRIFSLSEEACAPVDKTGERVELKVVQQHVAAMVCGPKCSQTF